MISFLVCAKRQRLSTGLGGEGAVLEPAECVTPLISFLKEVKKEHSGKFFNRKGEQLPW